MRRAHRGLWFLALVAAVGCSGGGGGNEVEGDTVDADPTVVSKMTGTFDLNEQLTSCDGTKTTYQYRMTIIPEDLQSFTYAEGGRNVTRSVSVSDQSITVDAVSGNATGSSQVTFSSDYSALSGAVVSNFPSCTVSTSFTGIRVTLPDDTQGNTKATALSISLNSTTNAFMDSEADVDYFKVTVSSPGTLTVKTTGNLDTEGYLTDGGGRVLDYSTYSSISNLNFSISLPVSPGIYYVAVRGSDRDVGTYVLVTSFGAAEKAAAEKAGQSDAEEEEPQRKAGRRANWLFNPFDLQ